MHFHENAHILCKLDENARILLKMHKTKFSEIGLASSKGISSKDPIRGTCSQSNPGGRALQFVRTSHKQLNHGFPKSWLILPSQIRQEN